MKKPSINIASGEKIEILSVDLLDKHRQLADALKRFAQSLKIELGWHYLLDIIWIVTQLEKIKHQMILDAGAGTGLLQWYLADHGANVISVDRQTRRFIPLHLRAHFPTQGLREEDLISPFHALIASLKNNQKKPFFRNLLSKANLFLQAAIHFPYQFNVSGSVTFYNQDLINLGDIPANSVDTIVAVSALEHNNPEELGPIVDELMRVLKPGGKLLATLTAASEKDWFHEPSKGWCYTENSLRKLFKLPSSAPSNYDHYDNLFEALKNNLELRDNLAQFYFNSGDNGMPWGKWDPQYQPVGICKIKSGV